MVEFQWWLLLVGLVIGGTLVAFLMTDWSRGDGDLTADEREAEATFLAAQLATDGRSLDRDSIARVLRAHQEYLRLPPPDAIVPLDASGSATWLAPSAGDGDPDGEPDEIRHGGGGRADGDLPPA